MRTNKNLFRQLLVPIFAISTIVYTNAATATTEGGVNGGGGCTIEQNGQIRLLDFAVNGSGADPSSRRGVQLGLSRTARAMGFDALSAEDRAKLIPLQTFLNERLAAWEISSPLVSRMLQNSTQYFRFYVSPFQFHFEDGSCPQRGLQGRISMAVVYKRDFGALISVPLFNRLTFTEQAGLLLHEYLRAMQVEDNNGPTNEEIQDLTYAILLRPPNSQNFDQAAGPFISRLSQSLADNRQKIAKKCEYVLGLSATRPHQANAQAACDAMKANPRDLQVLMMASHALNRLTITMSNTADRQAAEFWRNLGLEIGELTVNVSAINLNIILREANMNNWFARNADRATRAVIQAKIEEFQSPRTLSSRRQQIAQEFERLWLPLIQSGHYYNSGSYQPSISVQN